MSSLSERDADTEALLADLVEITRIPAPTFAEQERIDWLERRLASGPGSCRRDEAGNLIWRFGDGRPRVLVTAHVDTVFGPEVALEPQRHDGRLTGPGVGDNAAAIAVTISVLEQLAADDDVALNDAVVAFTVCEEGLGNLRGARLACSALQPDAVIALEGHGLDDVFVDAIGSLRAAVTVAGPGGHSWTDRGRPSAVHGLLELGMHIISLGDSEAPVNIGVVSGGTAVNGIASEAALLVEVRALDEVAIDRFRGELDRLQVHPDLLVTVEEKGRRPAGRLGRSEPLLQVVRGVRRELGLPDRRTAASTDANAALALGIPALALGVARGSDMHSPAESIELDSLAWGRLQLELVLGRLLGGRAA